MPDINSDEVVAEIRKEFPTFQGWNIRPNNSALFGTVTIDGKEHKIIVPGRDIGAGCSRLGVAEFFRSFIRQKVTS